MNTGENEQALRKILDMTRLISLVLLAVHFYYYGYFVFKQLGLVSQFSDRILENISKAGLFSFFHKSKLLALLFVFISLLGAKGRKNEKLKLKNAVLFLLFGLFFYFASWFILQMATI